MIPSYSPTMGFGDLIEGIFGNKHMVTSKCGNFDMKIISIRELHKNGYRETRKLDVNYIGQEIKGFSKEAFRRKNKIEKIRKNYEKAYFALSEEMKDNIDLLFKDHEGTYEELLVISNELTRN